MDKTWEFSTDVLAAGIDAWISSKILKSDMHPVVRVIAASPWIINAGVNVYNAAKRIDDTKEEKPPETKEEET